MRHETVFITGDVHDMHMGGLDQKWLRHNAGKTEMQCALKYSRLAMQYGINVTLFVTGLAVKTEPSTARKLANMHNVEIGGHTWNALKPVWKHMIYDRLFRSYYGPANFQENDIKKTIDTIKRITGTAPISWRTHAYRGDKTTFKTLSQNGIRVVSDKVGPTYGCHWIDKNLLSLPINTPPDHEHVYHGYFTQSAMDEDQLIRKSLSNIFKVSAGPKNWLRFAKEVAKRISGIQTPIKPFGENMYDAENWYAWLLSEIENRLKEKGLAVLLLHPADMEVLDEMKLLDTLFEFCQGYRCLQIKDALSLDIVNDL